MCIQISIVCGTQPIAEDLLWIRAGSSVSQAIPTSSFTMLQFLGTHLPREVLFELELMLLQTHTVYKVRGKLSLGIFFKTIFDHHAQVACG